MPACELLEHQRLSSGLIHLIMRVVSTLWQKEEFEQICSRESLTEKAAEISKTI